MRPQRCLPHTLSSTRPFQMHTDCEVKLFHLRLWRLLSAAVGWWALGVTGMSSWSTGPRLIQWSKLLESGPLAIHVYRVGSQLLWLWNTRCSVQTACPLGCSHQSPEGSQAFGRPWQELDTRPSHRHTDSIAGDQPWRHRESTQPCSLWTGSFPSTWILGALCS